MAQVVARTAVDGDGVAVAGAAVSLSCDTVAAQGTVEVLCREGLRFHHGGGRALEHHLTALAAGTGAYVHDIVCRQHHVLVVLHDDDGVAQVAQLFQRVDEPLVVTLVQADARLVENVEHVHQLRANLCGQAYALALASGKRG